MGLGRVCARIDSGNYIPIPYDVASCKGDKLHLYTKLSGKEITYDVLLKAVPLLVFPAS